MTVEELIRELIKLPPRAEVLMMVNGCKGRIDGAGLTQPEQTVVIYDDVHDAYQTDLIILAKG